jgi:hypothetical protein
MLINSDTLKIGDYVKFIRDGDFGKVIKIVEVDSCSELVDIRWRSDGKIGCLEKEDLLTRHDLYTIYSIDSKEDELMFSIKYL